LTAVCLFAAGAVYVIGGHEFLRKLLQVRSSATAALQPPTQAEMQRASQDTAAAATTDTGVPSVSLRIILIWSGAVVVAAVALFFATGRAQERRRD
jgi:hypothetical protein